MARREQNIALTASLQRRGSKRRGSKRRGSNGVAFTGVAPATKDALRPML